MQNVVGRQRKTDSFLMFCENKLQMQHKSEIQVVDTQSMMIMTTLMEKARRIVSFKQFCYDNGS
jgi:hypothetical protein